MAEVPARVCPASKSVPQHKDKPEGKGACVSSWTCVVYLTHHPSSALVLKDDVTGREFRVAIEPGRMCCWPNARFSHRVDVDAAEAQGAEPKGFRYMLGPMALSKTAGSSASNDAILYVEGGCGGCGGGCGGGDDGGRGGGTPDIPGLDRVIRTIGRFLGGAVVVSLVIGFILALIFWLKNLFS